MNHGTAGGLNPFLAGLVEIGRVLQVDMELFAVAYVCQQEGIAWHSFKCISDHADRDSETSWQAHVQAGQD